MERQEKSGFSGFDLLLGLGVLAVVAAGLPWLGQQLNLAKNARSRDHAARVAQAILDYHTEMGQWPAANGEPVDLTVLTAVPPSSHALGAMIRPGSAIDAAHAATVADARPWIEDVPVDSWGRPFVAAVYDHEAATAPLIGSPPVTGHAYPMMPPPGTTIVVVSAGRDGILQSDLAVLARTTATAFGGDDTGQVLQGRGRTAGGPRPASTDGSEP